MPPLTAIQTSFNGGEISSRMEGRVDTAIYPISTAEMLNFVPTVEGPAMKVPGFRYIRAAAVSSTWFTRFIFSRTQAYVLEWSEGKLRFFTNGGRIESDPVTPYEVTIPFTAAEAPAVWQQQSYDRLYLAHPAHPPGALTRTGAATFAYAALGLVNGPFADQNGDTAINVTVAGTLTVGGVATVTASSAIFLAGHVGSPVRIEAVDFNDITAWQVGIAGVVANTTRVRSDGKAYIARSAGRTGTIQPTHDRGTAWDGDAAVGATDVNAKGPYGVKWEYQHDIFGVGTITAIGGGGTTATITVTRRIPSSLGATASHRWSLGAFSALAGWPKIVLLAFGRMIFFTDFEIVASVVGDYGGGSVNLADYAESGLLTLDMAFRRRLDISNPVLWAEYDRDTILVGTAEGEYAIRKINSAQIFSSDNIECVPQSRYGSASVRPVRTGASMLFVQKNGRKLREAEYSLQNDRYVAPNINVWQRHILKSGARQLVFQQEPEELIWAVRADGVLALHPHVPEQEVKGFARRAHAAGAVLSAVAIPSQDGTTDEFWALVDAGAAGKSVECLADWWEEGESLLADAVYSDSAVSYSGAPRTTFPVVAGSIDYLAGQEVAILADGGVVPRIVLPAGPNVSFTLARAASKVHVGRPYAGRIKWLRPEIRSPQGGTVQGKRKRLVSAVLRLLETCGIKVDPGTGRLESLLDRPAGAAMDAPVPPFTGDTVSKSIGGEWNYDAQATIVSDDPLPCMVVAAMPTFTMEGA